MKNIRFLKSNNENLPVLPGLDFMMVVITFMVVLITVLLYLLQHFVVPIRDDLNAEFELLKKDYDSLKNLNILLGNKYDLIIIPSREKSVNTDLFENVQVIKADLSNYIKVHGDIQTQTNLLQEDFIQQLAESEKSFWQERAKELCKIDSDTKDGAGRNDDQGPPVFPQFQNASFDTLNKLVEYRNKVWAQYSLCKEEHIYVIGENLLRFNFNRWDQFNDRMNVVQVESAHERIKELVNENLDSGFRRIFVRGQWDPIGSDEHNFDLSSKRALYVANIIIRHLNNRGLQPGKDYDLIVEGLGKSKPLSRKGEKEEDWYSRLRRIELAFQRQPAAQSIRAN